jgi:wyosine [tRNA(Phe)-imidazoG37] synthetase (radical SAM superfamily)
MKDLLASPRTHQVYGPVPSRRLGASLGVDLVPFKVCSYDCVYCQLGPTRRISCEREAFLPPARLIEEIRRALVQGPLPDVITLAGSGEPTLYEPLGELIRALKALTGIPVALLTNGALFWKPEVRRDAALADLVLPSLDAGDEATFQAVNRPHPRLTLEETLQGLEAFRDEFRGSLWLEVMMVSGLNTREDQVRAIAREARRFRPDRVQLNTPVRPSRLGPEAIVAPDRLQAWCPLFTPAAEVIAAFQGTPSPTAAPTSLLAERLRELLARRPCTVEDASRGLSAAPAEVSKALAILLERGQARREPQGELTYYVVPAGGGAP